MRCTKIWSKTRLRWCTISFPIIMLRRKLHVTLYDSEHFKALNKLMLSSLTWWPVKMFKNTVTLLYVKWEEAEGEKT